MVILNFDAWCSIMKNISIRIWATDMYCVISLLLSIGTVQGSTDICLFLVQVQLRYIYLLLSHHHFPTISWHFYDLAILNTFLLDLEQLLWWHTWANHVVSFVALTPAHVDLFWSWLLDQVEQDMTSLWQTIVYIYPSCWVIDRVAISLRCPC